MRRPGRHCFGSGISGVAAGLLVSALIVLPAWERSGSAAGAAAADAVDKMKSWKPQIALVDMNAARGRELFVSKACVVCHSVNGVGGATGPSLDAEEASPNIDVFEFAARMWRGAELMLAFQKLELGYQILLSGRELADITAFAHSREEQKKLKESDIPADIRRMMRYRRI